jgi:AcrR family transcriptional regulator
MTVDMSRLAAATLTNRRNELSRSLILGAAVDVLERSGVSELTARAVARHANISERTVFRYFPTRDEFLDAVAAEARSRMLLPPPPRDVDELLAAPRALYEAFEARQGLVLAGLHSELADRIREGANRTRWAAIRTIVNAHAPSLDERARKIVATQICYYLGASTWRFHRFYFRLSLDDTVSCAETAIRLALESLKAGSPRRRGSTARRRC